MFKRCELDLSSLIGLKRHCEERGVIFFSTPISEAGLADLLRVGVPMLKNGSDCLGHLPLLRAMARSGLPTIISTGMATEPEIRDAVQAFREAGGSDLILLHCTSAYPTPPQDVNLRKIAALREKFRCPVGLSDHTEGTVAALGAVALGACMVEKHFTIDKNMAGPDHRFSADHAEFRELVQSVRLLERQLGSAELGPAESERDGRLQYKLSCMAARDLPCGHRVAAEDIVFRRPGTGLPPRDAQRLVGKELKRGVSSGDFLRVEDCR
jgi:N-acetylneuraminate synthase/N,N'-diacetyllegionaminate synthase